MNSAPKYHILIVDDQPEMLSELILLLEANNFRVSTAITGRQGFYRAQALRPNIILLDVQMPKMDGFATCMLLKEAPETEKIPVIFLTSAMEEEQRLKGLEIGAYDYVTKPFSSAEVLARIKIQLSLQNQRKNSSATTLGPTKVSSKDEVLLQTAQKIIRNNLGANLTLNSIAEEIGTYEKKLSRLFRQYLGTTVFSWLREEKINQAKSWLVNTNMEVQDISDELGYASSANFSTSFRQITGLTPSEYRKKLREKYNLN